MDTILALLSGCSHLKVFTLFTRGSTRSNIDIIHKLGSKPWSCTGLARFELHISGDQSRGTSNGATGETQDEDWVEFDVASLISRTYGWRLYPRKSNYQGVDSLLWNKDYMRRLFRLVGGLERLDYLIVGEMVFSCVDRPIGPVVDVFPYGR